MVIKLNLYREKASSGSAPCVIAGPEDDIKSGSLNINKPHLTVWCECIDGLTEGERVVGFGGNGYYKISGNL